MSSLNDRRPIFVLPIYSATMAVAFAAAAVASIMTAHAQSPTSMPWERHILPPDILWTTKKSQDFMVNKNRPRATKVDPTLTYISADEPIVQPGFPPLPNRADIPGAVPDAPKSVEIKWTTPQGIMKPDEFSSKSTQIKSHEL